MEDTKQTTNEFFILKMKFNGKEFESTTTDLRKSIESFKPVFLKTNVMFECTNQKGGICAKMIPVRRAKMIWRSKAFMDVFINHLIFKYG